MSESWTRFDYRSPVILHGLGAIDDLDAELKRQGSDDVLVVCGRTVAENTVLMDRIESGLGERLAGIFAETTPEKRLSTAVAAAATFRDRGADTVLGLGGGSSLDVATVTGLVLASELSHEALATALVETGTLPDPDSEPPPIVTVPTTLAGAALSGAAGITVDPDYGPGETPADGGVSAPALTPTISVSDPELVATTPPAVLRGSAMNGFDKALETPYARTATPVTDATALHALSLFSENIEALSAEDPAPKTLAPVVEATLLAQYGSSRPEASTLSLIHAFGHGLSRRYPLQQGVAHAIVAPHALRYLFDRVDGRRELLAEALSAPTAGPPASRVIDAVEATVDTLGLPRRLRAVDGPTQSELPAVARAVADDTLIRYVPPGLDPDVAALTEVLEAAW